MEEDINREKQIPELKIVKKQFPVTGMSCASCASNIETTLKKQPGVVKASVNLASQIATLEFNPSVVKPHDLKRSCFLSRI